MVQAAIWSAIEFEGNGIEVELNIGGVSPCGGVSLDDTKSQFTGAVIGASAGPGVGGCFTVTKSDTFTLLDAIMTNVKVAEWLTSKFE